MNNLLASPFSPSQLAIVIVVSVLVVALVVLNIVLAYVFHKRRERKLYDLLLQHQREQLMKQLEEMHARGTVGDDIPAEIQPFQRVAEPEAAPSVEADEEMEEGEEELAEELAPADEEDSDAVVLEEVVIDGKVIRYNRSFVARIVQASDEVKARYSELKNYILSFKGVKNRISWKKETFRLGRNSFAAFTVRGKTLCLCLATDPKRFADGKYKVIDLSVRSPKSKLPCMYRISADRRVKYAEEMIDALMAELGAERLERETEDFRPAYQTTQALIDCGLIKVVGGELSKLDLAEPVPVPPEGEQEPEAAEPPVTADESEEEGEEENEESFAEAFVEEEESDDAAEAVVIGGRVIRYNRSFQARIIQSSDAVKERYSYLKNVMLSYAGVKNRISWKKETFRRGRVTLASLVVRGKTLCLCLATDPKQFADSKYRVIDLSERSPKNKQPCLYRVTGDRKMKYAAELIDLVFTQNGLQAEEREYVAYLPPYEETEQLIEKGLVRVVGDTAQSDVSAAEPASEETAVPVEEIAVEEPAEAIAEEPASEETVQEPVEESAEQAEDLEEQVLADEAAVVQEETPQAPAEAEQEELPLDRDFEILEEVDVAEAEVMNDEKAEQLVEVKIVKKKNTGKKGIVNLDSLSRNYEAGAHVTVESLREKKLVARDVTAVKVLAKGSLNKPLIVEADDFSLVAVKMIVLTGGRVIRKTAQGAWVKNK